MGWFKRVLGWARRSPTDPVVAEICDQFESGEVYNVRLEPHGICEIRTKYLDVEVIASWFSSTRNPYYLRIGGDKYTVTTQNADLIIRSAMRRGDRLVDESLATLTAHRSARVQAGE